jgi:hypothetical protein
MDELVKLVSQKTGISEDMARTAVETVIGYLKDKLPGPVAGQIDSILGGSGSGQGIEGLTRGLGGILGQR